MLPGGLKPERSTLKKFRLRKHARIKQFKKATRKNRIEKHRTKKTGKRNH
jgi:hypothetical protein